MENKEQVKMKDYCVDVTYDTSLRISLPEGTDIDSLNSKCYGLDEFFQDPGSDFEYMIRDEYKGEIVSPNWGWRTIHEGITELEKDEYDKNYKGEFSRY